ncbi:Maf family protein [Candidatus Peregrinibacteria bacterium]|nr:MAG: Maf family protein [Candidatus Peregrinibacteria bacterium]
MDMEIILASQSPARKKILSDLGLTFRVVPSHTDESHENLIRPHAIAKRIALRKAEVVSQKNPQAWVIAADTFVVLHDGQLALKPVDRADAKRILSHLRGSYCDVYSGLAILNRFAKKQWVDYEKNSFAFSKIFRSGTGRISKHK